MLFLPNERILKFSEKRTAQIKLHWLHEVVVTKKGVSLSLSPPNLLNPLRLAIFSMQLVESDNFLQRREVMLMGDFNDTVAKARLLICATSS